MLPLSGHVVGVEKKGCTQVYSVKLRLWQSMELVQVLLI